MVKPANKQRAFVCSVCSRATKAPPYYSGDDGRVVMPMCFRCHDSSNGFWPSFATYELDPVTVLTARNLGDEWTWPVWLEELRRNTITELGYDPDGILSDQADVHLGSG